MNEEADEVDDRLYGLRGVRCLPASPASDLVAARAGGRGREEESGSDQ